MPSLLKKSYLFVVMYVISQLILVCTISYLVWNQSVYTDTRNMMLYQGLVVSQLSKNIDDKAVIIGANITVFKNKDELPRYIQDGFHWEEMKKNHLYEMNLKNLDGQSVYVYALKFYSSPKEKIIYLVSEYINEVEEQMHYEESLFYESFYLVIIAVLVLVGLSIIVVFMFYSTLIQPVRSISKWLLTPLEKIPLEKLKYEEFIDVATSYQNSVRNQKNLIEKEELFLTTMSHELRTPIAIISASVELLERLNVDPKIERVVNRISYATKNLDYLIKTILWLSRGNTPPLPKSNINLASIIEKAIHDNEYLLDGRDLTVSLKKSYDPRYEVNLNYGAVYLVLVNLVRNSFQHSADGEVSIYQSKSKVTFVNPIDVDSSNNSFDSYGCGLDLVQRLCLSCNFTFEFQINTNCATANINFES